MVDDEGDGEAVEDGGRGSGEMASTRSSEEEPMARRGSRERGKLGGLGAGARVDAGDDDRVVGGDASFEG